MKYRLLSKSQFEEFHEQFAQYLAAHGIDKEQWDKIKKEDDAKVKEMLEGFSDLIWKIILEKTQYLNYFTKDSINLFRCDKDKLYRILIRSKAEDIDLSTEEGLTWFYDNSDDKRLEYLKGQKDYSPDRNTELYEMIIRGAQFSDGILYKAVDSILS